MDGADYASDPEMEREYQRSEDRRDAKNNRARAREYLEKDNPTDDEIALARLLVDYADTVDSKKTKKT